MAVLNPKHLFEQADALAAKPTDRAARQADLRRAVSAAYYGVFHYILTAAADEFVGRLIRKSRRYTLIYRSVDHGSLRNLCMEVRKQQPSSKYQKYAPSKGFDENIRSFANLILELQEKRHTADYDPSQWFTGPDTKLIIASARSAIARFEAASPLQRKYFLTLLLISPR